MEPKWKEKNQEQDIRRKHDKRRRIAESRKLVKEEKNNNKRMKAERKGKIRKLKLKIWKTCKESDPKSFSINPTCYENSKALSRTNTDLDRPTKDSKKVNLVPENQQVQRDSKQKGRD